MNTRPDKIIGVVGGMGPEAGFSLGNRIIQNTPASKDQEHLSTILMSYPKYIGDRTAFLEGAIAVNPAFEIAKVVSKLVKAGAEVIGLACNTAHAPSIFDVILENISTAPNQVKLLNMPRETCRFIKENYPHVQRIGLMSTNGTFRAGIYENALLDVGYEVIVPGFEFQNNVIHNMIYDPDFGIKANPGKLTPEAEQLLNQALSYFKRNQAELIILGCTELPLVLPDSHAQGMILVNSTDALAKALVREALQLSEPIS